MSIQRVRIAVDVLLGALILACIALAGGLAYFVWGFIL